MPQLTIRGIAPEVVQGVSATLMPKLALCMAASLEDFTLDVLQTLSFSGGNPVATYPFVEVGWFERGQTVQDEAARLIDSAFKAAGIGSLEIVFKVFPKTAYYSDGAHY